MPFDIQDKYGLSTFLSGNCELSDIIQPTSNVNLNIILPGPIPPNPNELIASNKTYHMFEALKQQFDYIIIDTPPVGIVADALLLVSFADTVLFLVRHNYTRKQMLLNVLNTLYSRKVSNINIIINDLPISKNRFGSAYGYGYNYNYAYGYGYYHAGNEKQRNRIFDRIKKWLFDKHANA